MRGRYLLFHYSIFLLSFCLKNIKPTTHLTQFRNKLFAIFSYKAFDNNGRLRFTYRVLYS